MLKRTQTCGELTRDHVGQEVVLNGWVDTRRDHGGLIFIDLRDRYGLTQVVFEPGVLAGAEEGTQDPLHAAHDLRNEHVIGVKGIVAPAPRRQGKPQAQDRRHRGPGHAARGLQRRAHAPRSRSTARPRPTRNSASSTATSTSAARAMQAVFILRHQMAQLMRNTMSGPRLPRSRDPHPRPEHPRRGPRLPRPQPGHPRALLRLAAVAPALQAGADGRRVRPLLPDRPLLPRRGPPLEPPARVHPARRRDVVRRGRGRHRHDGKPRPSTWPGSSPARP